MLIVVGLVMPLVMLSVAHLIVSMVAKNITGYLTSDETAWVPFSYIFLRIHLLTLLILCLIIISVLPLAIELSPVPVKRAWQLIRIAFTDHGGPAANALGESFSLFGVLVFAIPVGTLLHGTGGFGQFSISYSGVIAVSMIYYIIANRRSIS